MPAIQVHVLACRVERKLIRCTERRKIWDKAFTPTALRNYHPNLRNRIRALTDQLDARVGKAVDLHEWLSYFGVYYVSALSLCAKDF